MLSGLDGLARGLLYELLIQTGLRAGEARALRVRDLSLDDPDAAMLVLQAKYTNTRSRCELPLTRGLAIKQLQFIRDKRNLPEAFLFNGACRRLTDKGTG